MVKLLEKRGPRLVKPLEIDEPSGRRVDRARHRKLHTKTVPVKTRALVSGRHVGKAMCRLEPELVHEPYVHAISVRPGRSLDPCTSSFRSSRARSIAARPIATLRSSRRRIGLGASASISSPSQRDLRNGALAAAPLQLR